jgi:hypothetical protein
MLGAVWIGGQLVRSLPHEQVLVFPVGSAFPNAVRFNASWQRVGDHEQSGGITLSFPKGAPLQTREHASLPDGDYVVTIIILQSPQSGETIAGRDGVQTNIERRVTLSGGETNVALAAGGF